MLSRRTFIKNLATAGTACAIIPEQLFAAPAMKEIGIQLYTIRDLVAQDLAGTLEKLAEIGFQTIETANYQDGKFYGLEPAKFQSLVKGIGLNPLSSHSSLTTENIAKTVDDTAAAGMKYLVQPSIPAPKRQTLDHYRKIAAELNEMGEVCNKSGLTLGYHNHAYEFEVMEGKVPYNILLEETEADLVTMQLDTYWVLYGGYRPEDYFNNFPGRFKLWHVKDMTDGESRESTEIGSGRIDFSSLFSLKKKAGLEHLFIEQEDFKMDPWKSLAKSWKYLNNL